MARQRSRGSWLGSWLLGLLGLVAGLLWLHHAPHESSAQLEARADHELRQGRPLAALELHRRAVEGSATGTEWLVGCAAVAEDLRQLGRSQEAVQWVDKALSRAAQLPGRARAVLMMQRADLLECAGDPVSALHSYEAGVKLLPGPGPKHAIRHADLLRSTVRSTTGMPAAVRTAMIKRSDELVAAVLASGARDLADQLPGVYVAGLLARPWHSMEAGLAGWLVPAATLMMAATAELSAEYEQVRPLMREERECIHDPQRGHWRRFELNGPGHSKDEQGCATAAPRACALWRRLAATGMRIQRMGWSSIGSGAHLRPHCGSSNTQLKWHLGLRVPGEGCARIRVANETRSWAEGQINFFDDSFEHEAWNSCDAERVVMQLVFEHPQLKPNQRLAIGTDTHDQENPVRLH